MANIWWTVFNVRTDILHVTGDVNYVLPFGRAKSRVLTVHDLHHLENLRGITGWLYAQLWWRWPISCADGVIAVSKATARQLMEHGLNPRFLRVVWNPIPSLGARSEESGSCASSRVESGRFQLLQIGTKPNKNLRRVIKAVASLPVDLTVVGTVDPSRRTRLTLEAPRVVFEGRVSNQRLGELFRNADALVIASTTEGFGLPLIEAQASGIPVVASDIVPLREVSGGIALFVDPLDVDSIREGVRCLIEDEQCRSRLGALGKKNALRYDPAHVSNLIGQFYREILAAESSGSQ